MKKIFILLLISSLLVVSCKNEKPENQPDYIKQRFQKVKELAEARSSELFGIFEKDLSKEELMALEFLYAFMPLSDLAEYNGEFFLQHVKISLQAKSEIIWGKNMPEDVFYHFVLPHRINNENLDSFRAVYYEELKDRITGMNMYDAALEINHWCHEKVEYQPADIRTSSPMSTIKSAFGRCGEESTLTVAALRTVCIPARQVYTPRWAHSDDNHAWVEVWVDGKWFFLGACEPEPVLNLGWFNEPASRAMLIHARVFGKYAGSEETNSENSQFTNINVTDRYAKTHKQIVRVLDKNGKPVSGANVEFQVYNYAEFYTLATKTSDKNGEAFLTTGLGDLLIWAYKDSDFGMKKITVGLDDIPEIFLSGINESSLNMKLEPPPATNHVKTEVTDQQRETNKERFQFEDSVRNSYVNRFLQEPDFKEVAGKGSLPADWYRFIKLSRGNSNQILSFMLSHYGDEKLWIEPLLSSIAEKDLRDTRTSILDDHLNYSMAYADKTDKETFTKYILSPRIANEMLVAYRGFLLEKFGTAFVEKSRQDISNLINWMKGSIEIYNEAQAYSLPISPVGVYNLKIADSYSRDIFFVAACRACGIPARLEQGTFVPQYKQGENWIDIWFEEKPEEFTKVKLEFKCNQKGLNFVPQYYHHFSLAQFNKNNYKTLELDYYVDFDKLGAIEVKPGKYRLITSNRMESGKVLVNMEFFTISSDTIIPLEIPSEVKTEKFGEINPDGEIRDEEGQIISIGKIINSKKTVVVLIDQGTEPGKHLLNDFNSEKEKFDKTKVPIVFILPEGIKFNEFPFDKYNLPSNLRVYESTNSTLNALTKGQSETKNPALPLVLIIQPETTVIYRASGYAIGRGNEILKRL